jgi:iron complex outermembrane receptor protein
VEGQFFWAALSRAVRAPARLDRELVLPPNPPYFIAGGPDFVSEVANVLEFGHRAQPSPSWSYAATLFLHDWRRLRSGQTPPNAQVQNMIEGRSWGVEAWGTWQAMPAWRLSAGLNALKKNLHLNAGSSDPVGPSNLGDDPAYQWSLRSALTLTDGQEVDVTVRRVGPLREAEVPAYTAFDARYAWRISQELEFSIVGDNLLDRAHAEFGAASGRSEIGRSLSVWLRWSL